VNNRHRGYKVADLKDAIERFVRPDMPSGQASQAVEAEVELYF